MIKYKKNGKTYQLKLKEKIKNVLIIITIVLIGILLAKMVVNDLSYKFNTCDKLKGYACTIYDVQSLRK